MKAKVILVVALLSCSVSAQNARNLNVKREISPELIEYHAVQPLVANKGDFTPPIPFKIFCLKESEVRQNCVVANENTCRFLIDRYLQAKPSLGTNPVHPNVISFQAFSNYINYDPDTGIASMNTGKFPMFYKSYLDGLAAFAKVRPEVFMMTWGQDFIEGRHDINKDGFAKFSNEYFAFCSKYNPSVVEKIKSDFESGLQSASRSGSGSKSKPKSTQ